MSEKLEIVDQLANAGIGLLILAAVVGIAYFIGHTKGEERGYRTGHGHGAIAQRHNRPGRRPIED